MSLLFLARAAGRSLSCTLIATASLLAAPAPSAQSLERGPAVTRSAAPALDEPQARAIVKYRANPGMMRALAADASGTVMRPQHATAFGKRMGVALRDGRVLGSRTQGVLASGMSSAQLAAELAVQPEVEWAVPDMRRHLLAVPNDPYLPAEQTTITPATGQWYLRAPDSTTVAAIDAVGAWDLSTGSASTTVAILDTGVRLDHPDLAAKLHPGYDFVSSTAVSNDGNARDADPSDPGDWTTANECGFGRPATISRWHGTQVAGLIGAATNNGIGMAGVGYNVMLLPVRVLGRCGGFDSDIIAAMRWAAGLSSEVGIGSSVTVPNTHRARVINMSLGSEGACIASWRDALTEVTAAGVTVVVAAGNDTGQAVSTPANCPGAIAVAGLRHVGSKVGFSNVGPQVSLAAPAGNCVNLVGTCLYPLLTTINTGTTSPLANTWSDGGANASVGTSFAAPIVAGTVGLMLSLNPALSPAQVKSLLQASARPFPTTGGEAGTATCHAPNGVDQFECYCTTSTCGAGMLNAAGAVAAALAPAANISLPSASVAAGSSITLTAGASTATAGRSIVAYQWSIVSGASLVQIVGSATGTSLTLNALATGDVVVQIVVTDNLGIASTSTATLGVSAASTASGGSGGGGGGALGAGWLLALLAVTGLAWHKRRRA